MKKNKKRGGEEMNALNENINTPFSLSSFIQKNKSKIDKITPKNPVIKKDDEWRDETCWDELRKRIDDK